MIIYLDVLIIENFIVNMFLIYITAVTLRFNIKIKNIMISSLIGSVYVLTIVYPFLRNLTSIPFKIITAAIMIFFAFGKKKIILNLKAMAIFIFYSMLLAGLCIFIQFNNQSIDNYSINISNVSYKKVLLSIMIIYIIMHRLITSIRDRKDVTNLIYDVEIFTKNSSKKIKAFLDTGNELREPVTNLPVMIVEKSVFEDLVIENFEKYYIPFKVISGYGGMLEGFKPKHINVYLGQEVEKREIIIALSDNQLSEQGEYKALLSRGII